MIMVRLLLFVPTAYAAAIHDAIVDNGPLHRELSYFSWLRYKAIEESIYDARFSPKRHYTEMRGEELYTQEHLQRNKSWSMSSSGFPFQSHIN